MIFTNKTFRSLVISFGLICGVVFAGGQPLYAHSHPKAVRLGHSFNLKHGEEVQLKGTNIKIKLVEVQDSRCPRTVTCVWAGNGAVQINFSLNRKNSQTLTLNTAKTSALPGEQEYGGYKVSLLGLNPYPQTAQGIKPGEYAATLLITKSGRR